MQPASGTERRSEAERIGVCSWSLRPGSLGELTEGLRAVGVSAVQLALESVHDGRWSIPETQGALHEAGVDLRSGMIAMIGEDYSSLESIRLTGGVRSDDHWAANLKRAIECAAIARRLSIGLVTFHAGFVPESSDDPERVAMVERLRALADVFGAEGVRIAFETGQETPAVLLELLESLDRPSVGVNFDPANLILYGTGDPIAALEALAPWVRQIHVKDARRTRVRGTWGTEVPVGQGEVDWPAFFGVLRRKDIACDLMIEREAGPSRVADMRRARELCEQHLTSAKGRGR